MLQEYKNNERSKRILVAQEENEKESDQFLFKQAEPRFMEWATRSATPILSLTSIDDTKDLDAIAEAIGEAKFVALSEGFHNCKEMMALHHRIIRYLIENHGFNTILSESSFARTIHDYVQGKDIPENKLWSKDTSIVKFYGAWEEGRKLIEYMRDYNHDHDNILEYYGTDIGGFYENWKILLDDILQYLEKVDMDHHLTLCQRLHPFMDMLSSSARLNYSEKLTLSQRNELAAILDESVAKFNLKEVDYILNSTNEDFQWTRQSLRSLQWAENFYRNYEDMKNTKSGKYVGLNGREIALARNSLWVLQQRKDAKVIWIDHVIHTKTRSQYQNELWGFLTPAGQILKQSLGNDFFVIGMCYGGGRFWNKWQQPPNMFVDSIPPWDITRRSLEKSMSNCGNGNFFLNWSKAPQTFECQHWMQTVFSMRENDYFIQIEPREWDSCIYLDIVNPATPGTISV